jgi:hypothetical protein
MLPCCNGYIRMLQASICIVSSVFCTRILQVFQMHGVSSVFFCMLQVLYLDVVKVDRDVAHVAMVFQIYVPNILSIFIRMLQRFHLNIVKVDWSVAWRGRWLSLPLGRSSGSTDVGFPERGRGSLRRTRARVLRWDEEHGARCGCRSGTGVKAVSGCDIACGPSRRSVSNIVALKLLTDHNRSCADFI